jgi:hypothetical protein
MSFIRTVTGNIQMCREMSVNWVILSEKYSSSMRGITNNYGTTAENGRNYEKN